MELVKRKRDSRVEDDHSTKIRRQELPNCYRRVRNISELLMKGARLDRGHFVGVLHSIEREPEGTTLLLISDGSDKVLICQFDSLREFDYGLNSRVNKEIKVALTMPFRQPITTQRRNSHAHKLVFQPYCFILDGTRFEDLAGLDMPDSSEPEMPNTYSRITSPPHGLQKMAHSAGGPQQRNSYVDESRRSTQAYQKPKTWTSISDAINAPPGTTLTIAGVVKDISPLHQFNSGDLCAEYKLHDDTCFESQYLEVKLFATTDKHLPPLTMSDIGTVLLVSKVRITASAKANYLHARGNKSVYRYCCLSSASDDPFVHHADGTSYDEYRNLPIHRATDEEKEGMKRLLCWARGELRPNEQMPKPLGRRETSHRLIEEINYGTSFDGTFELLHIDADSWNTYAYVTDYTQNNRLVEPGVSSWRYPKGQRTLKIKFFDSLGAQAHALDIGSICRIKNIRIKFENGALLGLCGDRGEIRQVKPEDTFYQNLQARKRCLALEEQEAASRDEDAKWTRSPIRSPIRTLSSPRSDPAERSKPVPPSTVERVMISSATNHQVTPEPPPPPKEYPPFPSFMGNIEHSDIVECVNPDSHRLLTLQEISNLSQGSVIFRFRARVVDINPANINQVITPYCAICESVDFKDDKCVSCQSSNGLEYRVRVELIFQDSTGILSMRVDDDYATKFFRLPQQPTNDRASLAQRLLRRFDLLMGTTSAEGEELVGGVSEILELKGRNWWMRADDGTALARARWRVQHNLVSCRIKANPKG